MAAFVLGQIGANAKESISAPVTAVKDRDTKVREVAIHALGEVGDHDPAVVRALAGALKDQEEENRRLRSESPGLVGAGAKSALPEIRTALRDRSGSVREAAMEALQKVEVARDAIRSVSSASIMYPPGIHRRNDV